MVIAQRISSHRQPGLSCSPSVFGIEITVVKIIYTDIYMYKDTYIYVYIYTYIHTCTLRLHWTFPSADALLILRVSAQFGAECGFTWAGSTWGWNAFVQPLISTVPPFLCHASATAGATKRHCSSAPESADSRKHLAAFDSNSFSCRFMCDEDADVIRNLLCASALTLLPFSPYFWF